MKLEFVRKASRRVLSTRVFDLREDTSVHPATGQEGQYYVLDCPDWVNIVAVTPERELVMVRQWRHGTACAELEIPAGALEAGEDPATAAARELLEETGFAAERCSVIGSVRPNCAIQSNTCFTVLAEGCRRVGETRFDEGEQIALELLPAAQVMDRVRDGTLRSGMMLVALLWWLDRERSVAWPR